ncbi:hypothetical protein BaRGS_00004246, partial [Batillaria attramentaria]
VDSTEHRDNASPFDYVSVILTQYNTVITPRNFDYAPVIWPQYNTVITPRNFDYAPVIWPRYNTVITPRNFDYAPVISPGQTSGSPRWKRKREKKADRYKIINVFLSTLQRSYSPYI